MPNYVTINTPLRLCPEGWLRYIEPNIVRAEVNGLDCWWWQGSMKQQSGEDRYPQVRIPTSIRGQKKYVNARRYIARMFWDITGSHVYMTCDQPRCVNPDHMVISTPNDPNFRRG